MELTRRNFLKSVGGALTAIMLPGCATNITGNIRGNNIIRAKKISGNLETVTLNGVKYIPRELDYSEFDNPEILTKMNVLDHGLIKYEERLLKLNPETREQALRQANLYVLQKSKYSGARIRIKKRITERDRRNNNCVITMTEEGLTIPDSWEVGEGRGEYYFPATQTSEGCLLISFVDTDGAEIIQLNQNIARIYNPGKIYFAKSMKLIKEEYNTLANPRQQRQSRTSQSRRDSSDFFRAQQGDTIWSQWQNNQRGYTWEAYKKKFLNTNPENFFIGPNSEWLMDGYRYNLPPRRN